MGTSTGSIVFLEQTSEDYKSSAPLQIPGQARTRFLSDRATHVAIPGNDSVAVQGIACASASEFSVRGGGAELSSLRTPH